MTTINLESLHSDIMYISGNLDDEIFFTLKVKRDRYTEEYQVNWLEGPPDNVEEIEKLIFEEYKADPYAAKYY